MSLKLKRNMPLVLSLLAVVLVLILVFGNLRVGATNVHLGTWTELRVSAAATTGSSSAAATSPQVEAGGELSGADAALQAAQPVFNADQPLDGESNY